MLVHGCSGDEDHCVGGEAFFRGSRGGKSPRQSLLKLLVASAFEKRELPRSYLFDSCFVHVNQRGFQSSQGEFYAERKSHMSTTADNHHIILHKASFAKYVSKQSLPVCGQARKFVLRTAARDRAGANTKRPNEAGAETREFAGI